MKNHGLGVEQSVSWTSGNYAYSDSYYNYSSDWYTGEESDRNEIDPNQIEDDESWKQFNELLPRSNGTSSSSYSSEYSNSSSDRRYLNSDSYWSSSEGENTISSDSSFSSSSLSSTTSSCSSCSETYQNSALASEQDYRRNKRKNSVPNEPLEPVGVWRYQNGQLVTLEENADIDGYFMNLSQAEEEMMRNKMCDAEGGFWCNQTVNYEKSNFGFPGLFGGNKKKHKKSSKPVKPELTE